MCLYNEQDLEQKNTSKVHGHNKNNFRKQTDFCFTFDINVRHTSKDIN